MKKKIIIISSILTLVLVSSVIFNQNPGSNKNIGGRGSNTSNTDSSGNTVANLMALDDVNDSITSYPKSSYSNISTSTLIKTGSGQLYGVIINSHTSGTLKLWDSTAAATTTLANTMTFSAVATTGERFVPFYGATFGTGLYASTGGTVDLTILYR